MTLTYEQDTSSSLVPSASSLDDLRLLSMPDGGTDRLTFMTWDTIEVRGMGQDTIQLEGYYVIERLTPTTSDWVSASVDIIMRELSVVGVSDTFGVLRASVNTDIGKQSRGQVKPGTISADRADFAEDVRHGGLHEIRAARPRGDAVQQGSDRAQAQHHAHPPDRAGRRNGPGGGPAVLGRKRRW
jgi:hypothetical protein